jgi:heterotetrameric sarcosine oxidase delta subunit
MMTIDCIHCGTRNASEFRYLGETGHRPDPNAATPEEWRDYLYFHRNPSGWTTERWLHRAGCRRFLIVERNTATNEIRAVWAPGAAAATTPAEGVSR